MNATGIISTSTSVVVFAAGDEIRVEFPEVQNMKDVRLSPLAATLLAQKLINAVKLTQAYDASLREESGVL